MALKSQNAARIVQYIKNFFGLIFERDSDWLTQNDKAFAQSTDSREQSFRILSVGSGFVKIFK